MRPPTSRPRHQLISQRSGVIVNRTLSVNNRDSSSIMRYLVTVVVVRAQLLAIFNLNFSFLMIFVTRIVTL